MAKESHISMEEANRTDQEEVNINMRVIKTVQTTVLKVKRSDTIREIKTELQRVEGVDAKLLELFLSGTFLKNDRSVSDYDIADGSTVNVHVSAGREMKINVEMPMGKTIPLNVKEGDTVQRIKKMVHDTTRVPPERQMLVYHGTTLNDTHALSAYGIAAESRVYMVVKESDRMQILIGFPDGEVASFTVRTWYTVWDVKTVIKSRTRVTQEKQNLSYDGKRLEDRLTMAECELGFRPTLELSYLEQMHGMRILIKSALSDTRLDVHSSDDVYVLKKRIEEETGVPCDQQRLIFTGRQMEDDRTLGDYNVREGSTVHFVLRLRGS